MRPSLLLPLALAAVAVSAPAAQAAAPIQIRTLSNRADLVSDGDALVAITLPKRAQASQLSGHARRARRDERVRPPRADGRLVGVVERAQARAQQRSSRARRARAPRS